MERRIIDVPSSESVRRPAWRHPWKDLHDNIGYSPYEGRQIKGWLVTAVSRGRVVVEDGKLNAQRGSGHFLPCASPDSARPQGQTAPELQAMSRFGAKPLF